ncbi:hypothetical protein SO802_018751 [Lithocarpus litseifolius]|uniref:Uncharacterized protein n=1 Tax=Lithocarpus litseifolius TaxID=425828 RepID=A0AAW2CMV9_9ROSI
MPQNPLRQWCRGNGKTMVAEVMKREHPGVKILSESSHSKHVICKEIHKQRGNSDLVALGVSKSRVSTSVVRQVDASSSVDGLLLMRVLDVPATGKESALRCGSVFVNPDSGKAISSGFTGSGAEET